MSAPAARRPPRQGADGPGRGGPADHEGRGRPGRPRAPPRWCSPAAATATRCSRRWPRPPPGTRWTGRGWTCGGATSGSCRRATRSATPPRPGRRCWTRCRWTRARVHAMPAVGRRRTAPTWRRRPSAYAAELAAAAGPGDHGRVPAFDVLMLGVGPGHPCGLALPRASRRCGRPTRRWSGVHGAPKPPPTRISLTLPAIRAAREVWLLAAGEDKAGAVAPGPVRRRARSRPRPRAPTAGPARCGCWTGGRAPSCRRSSTRPASA